VSTVETLKPISQTFTFFNGAWAEGNVAIMGARTHAAWLATVVFDGGRWFEGFAPDLDRHMERVNRSALALGLKPLVSVAEWLDLAREGVSRFTSGEALYVRPMYWAEAGLAGGGVGSDPETTRWCLCLYEAPMPGIEGAKITLSPFRKPTPDAGLTSAKASCLYPNHARALAEAGARGFGNALMRDANGNIAELANANVFLVKDGVARTPVASGVFLAGITRARVMGLLRADGVAVEEASLSYEDFLEADEIFMVGNFSKVAALTGIEDRPLPVGPVARRARPLYFDWAKSQPRF
jgi:branched-chain amino acid aminotransferase